MTRGVVISSKRKGLATAGVVALIATGAAACGTAQATTPQGKVQNAFTKLGDQKSLTVGLGFDASADQIYSILQGQDGFTKSDAATMAGLHVQYAISSDKPLSQLKTDGKGSAIGFLLSDDPAGKKNLAEVRVIGGTLYLRADLKAMSKLGATPGAGGASKDDFAGLDQFLNDPAQLPPAFGPLKAAIKGQWISIDTSVINSLSKKAGGGSAAAPKLDAASQAKIVAALKKALADNATFKDLGNHDGADQVQVTVPARQLAKELKTGLAPALTKIPGFKPADLNGLDSVPNKTVTAELSIKDGSLSAVSVDIAQFDDKAHTGKLPLKLSLAGGSGPVTAPAGAHAITMKDITNLISSFTLPGTDDTSSGSADDAVSNGYFDYTPL